MVALGMLETGVTSVTGSESGSRKADRRSLTGQIHCHPAVQTATRALLVY